MVPFSSAMRCTDHDSPCCAGWLARSRKSNAPGCCWAGSVSDCPLQVLAFDPPPHLGLASWPWPLHSGGGSCSSSSWPSSPSNWQVRSRTCMCEYVFRCSQLSSRCDIKVPLQAQDCRFTCLAEPSPNYSATRPKPDLLPENRTFINQRTVWCAEPKLEEELGERPNHAEQRRRREEEEERRRQRRPQQRNKRRQRKQHNVENHAANSTDQSVDAPPSPIRCAKTMRAYCPHMGEEGVKKEQRAENRR